MKMYFFIILVNLSFHQSYSQWWGVNEQLWQSSNGFKTSVSRIDNSVCVTGSFGGSQNNSGLHNQGGFVSVYNDDGTLKWQRIYNAPKPIKTVNVTDTYGNIIVSGAFNGDMEVGDTTFSTGGAYLIKYDKFGNILFALHDLNSFVNHIAIDSTNNIYLAGIPVMNRTSVFGKPFTKEYFLAKVDPIGNVLWVKDFYCFETYNYDFGFCIDSEGNIYSTGTFSQYSNNQFTDSVQLVNSGGWDGYVAKYNDNLELQWVKTIKGGVDEVCSRIGIANNGEIYIAGYLGGSNANPFHFFDTVSIYSYSMTDVFIAKYNSSGDCQWVRTAVGNGADFVTGVFVDNNNDAFITGFAGSLGDSIVFEDQSFNFPHDNIQMFIAQYDSGGNLKWAQLSQGDNSYAEDVSGNGSNLLFVTGSIFGNFNFGNVTLTGNANMFLLKLDYGAITGYNVPPATNRNDFTVFPNPANGTFNVSFNSKDSNEAFLRIINANGVTVHIEKISFNSSFKKEIDLHSKSRGTYFIEITCGEERITKRVVSQ